MSFFLTCFYALFLWWFTTGAIFAFYGRSQKVVRGGLFFFTLLLGLALLGQVLLRDRTDTLGIYLSVTAGVIVWGWQVASYYLGYVTGPRFVKQQVEATFGDANLAFESKTNTLTTRFKLAALSGIYHELLIVGFLALQLWLTQQSPNQWGVWVFVGLWIMHSCGKVAVFLGVRNFQIDFLPDHLAYVGVLISPAQKNRFLPVALLIGSIVGCLFYLQARQPTVSSADQIGSILVGTMILLGVIELCLLVMPLPATLLGWEIRRLDPPAADGARG